jgi:hypothetical protein
MPACLLEVFQSTGDPWFYLLKLLKPVTIGPLIMLAEGL